MLKHISTLLAEFHNDGDMYHEQFLKFLAWLTEFFNPRTQEFLSYQMIVYFLTMFTSFILAAIMVWRKGKNALDWSIFLREVAIGAVIGNGFGVVFFGWPRQPTATVMVTLLFFGSLGILINLAREHWFSQNVEQEEGGDSG